jgi:peptidoglycan/xylan/chitin deacetylase (PgdA/CDA1 family)
VRRPRGTILVYHALGDCADDRVGLFLPEEAFAEQMELLRRFARVVSLDDVLAGRVGPGRPAVAITFDDGYRSVLHAGAPILARHGFPATVFVPTDLLGRRNAWDPETSCPVELMDADELAEAERAGLALESHGHGHVDLRSATEAEAEADLSAGMAAFEQLFGRRPRRLAYPFGRASPAAQRVAARLGFEAAFTADVLHGGRFAWERAGVNRPDGAALFAAKALGLYLPLRRSRLGARAYEAAKPLIARRRWS